MNPGWQEVFGPTAPVALVTGSARRVGRHVAEHLAAEGYRIAVHANRSLAEAESFASALSGNGIEAKAFQADLSDNQAVEDLFDKVHWYFGRIDVLVNSASIWYPTPLEELEHSQVETMFRTNTLAVLQCCRWAGLRMIEQRTGGAIINIGDWSVTRPAQGFAAYLASKGALEALTRSLAVDLAAENPAIRVNAILPGQVLLPEGATETRREAALQATLVKRLGRPEDVARAVQFLVESPFITGVSLPVDGGRSIFSGQFVDASISS